MISVGENQDKNVRKETN